MYLFSISVLKPHRNQGNIAWIMFSTSFPHRLDPRSCESACSIRRGVHFEDDFDAAPAILLSKIGVRWSKCRWAENNNFAVGSEICFGLTNKVSRILSFPVSTSKSNKSIVIFHIAHAAIRSNCNASILFEFVAVFRLM